MNFSTNTIITAVGAFAFMISICEAIAEKFLKSIKT